MNATANEMNNSLLHVHKHSINRLNCNSANKSHTQVNYYKIETQVHACTKHNHSV